MQVTKGGNIITKEKFDGKFALHVEFRVPYLPDAKGQGRGNSGVYLQGRYEVRVLDSYGLDSKDDDCGAILQGLETAGQRLQSTPDGLAEL